ncbi:MAG: ribosome-associated translation inhibitor RaiA [Gemmatimonadetes bacterium]|nr:ribosome-associated translation inhibitor RaiA [Gemmatimonadota bacterium]NNM07183.1 ribosome-associated translation inhibitor RaiA [Gemmatimonadota bacterium]
MRVQIAARHCEIPEPIRQRTEEQLEKLSKYEPRLSGAEVVFEVEKHLKKVDAVLKVDREEPVHAAGEGTEFREAVDQMVDRLSRMLRRRRKQLKDYHRAGGSEPFSPEP